MIIPFEVKSYPRNNFFYVKCDSCSLNFEMDFIYSQSSIRCPRCGKREVLDEAKYVEFIKRIVAIQFKHINFLNFYFSITNKEEIDIFIFEHLKYKLSSFLKDNFNIQLDDSRFTYKSGFFTFKTPDYHYLFKLYVDSVVSKEIKDEFKCINLYMYIINTYHSNEDTEFSFKHRNTVIML
jgi:ribosomal protein S27E